MYVVVAVSGKASFKNGWTRRCRRRETRAKGGSQVASLAFPLTSNSNNTGPLLSRARPSTPGPGSPCSQPSLAPNVGYRRTSLDASPGQSSHRPYRRSPACCPLPCSPCSVDADASLHCPPAHRRPESLCDQVLDYEQPRRGLRRCNFCCHDDDEGHRCPLGRLRLSTPGRRSREGGRRRKREPSCQGALGDRTAHKYARCRLELG